MGIQHEVVQIVQIKKPGLSLGGREATVRAVAESCLILWCSAIDALGISHWSLIESPIFSDRLKNWPGHLPVPTISLHLIVQVLLTPLQRQTDQLKKVLKLRNGGRCLLQRLFCCGQKNSVHCKFQPKLIINMLHFVLLLSSKCGDISPCFLRLLSDSLAESPLTFTCGYQYFQHQSGPKCFDMNPLNIIK